MKSFNWKIAAASAKGKGHKECQDSFTYITLKNINICIVTDGAGSQKNSKLGSYLTSRIALKLFKQYASKNKLDMHKLPKDECVSLPLNRTSLNGTIHL